MCRRPDSAQVCPEVMRVWGREKHHLPMFSNQMKAGISVHDLCSCYIYTKMLYATYVWLLLALVRLFLCYTPFLDCCCYVQDFTLSCYDWLVMLVLKKLWQLLYWIANDAVCDVICCYIWPLIPSLDN